MVVRVDEALQRVERSLPAGIAHNVWSRMAEGCRRHAAHFMRAAV